MESYTVSTECPTCGMEATGTVQHFRVNGSAVHKGVILCVVGHRTAGDVARRALERCPGCNGRLLRA